MRSRLVLASASPARLATLRSAGLEPDVLVSGVDESAVSEPEPSALAQRLAIAKARAVAAQVSDAWVLGCDSVLELDGAAHGKPQDAEEAVARWRRMRGRSGVLHTGHCLVEVSPGGERRERAESASTLVHFAALSEADIDAYVATGEPLRVAGAFTVDGLGAPFVTGVEGDHHNVVGLSLPLLRMMFRDLGVAWPELWKRFGTGAPRAG